jgi:hypothetical protein
VHVTDVHASIERTEIFTGCEHISSGGLLKLLAAEGSESVREQAAAYGKATASQEVSGQRHVTRRYRLIVIGYWDCD